MTDAGEILEALILTCCLNLLQKRRLTIVTKPFGKKCRPLCTLIGKSMHSKVMAVFRHKNQLDARIQLAYILLGA